MLNDYPRVSNFTLFCSTIARFPDTWGLGFLHRLQWTADDGRISMSWALQNERFFFCLFSHGGSRQVSQRYVVLTFLKFCRNPSQSHCSGFLLKSKLRLRYSREFQQGSYFSWMPKLYFFSRGALRSLNIWKKSPFFWFHFFLLKVWARLMLSRTKKVVNFEIKKKYPSPT